MSDPLSDDRLDSTPHGGRKGRWLSIREDREIALSAALWFEQAIQNELGDDRHEPESEPLCAGWADDDWGAK